MAKRKHNNVKMLQKIREELSEEMARMTPKQRREYAKAAKEVYRGLAKMVKIRSLAK